MKIHTICIHLVFTFVLIALGNAQSIELPRVLDLPLEDGVNWIESSSGNALKSAIGNARIVMLGERGHLDGTTLDAKVKMIQFLQAEMGFDVLIEEMPFEGSIYAIREMRGGLDSLTGIYADLYGHVSAYPSAMRELALFNELRMKEGDTLFCAGMDVLIGHYSDYFGPDFERFIDSCGRTIRADWAYQRVKEYFLLGQQLSFDSDDQFGKYIHKDGIKEIAIAFSRLRNLCETKLMNCRCSDQFRHIPAILNARLGRLAHYEKNFKTNRSKAPLNAAFTAERDKSMAKNVFWLIDTLYAGHKVILSASSFHISRKLSDYPNPRLPQGQKAMGDYLHERYGTNLYSICFLNYGGVTGLADHFLDTVDTRQVPVASLESTLHQNGHRFSFVDFASNELNSVSFFMNPTLGYAKVPWSNCFDAAYFIDEMSPRKDIVYWDRIKKRIDPKGKYPGSWRRE